MYCHLYRPAPTRTRRAAAPYGPGLYCPIRSSGFSGGRFAPCPKGVLPASVPPGLSPEAEAGLGGGSARTAARACQPIQPQPFCRAQAEQGVGWFTHGVWWAEGGPA